MQYYNQSSYTGYQNVSDAIFSRSQASNGHLWYNHMTFHQYPTAECINQQLSYYQQSDSSSQPASYHSYSPLSRCTQNTAQISQATGGNNTSRTAPQNTFTKDTLQNDHMIQRSQNDLKSCPVSSNNPLRLTFTNLRQAIGDEQCSENENGEKYGDRKPPYSYVAMIHMAMMRNPNKKSTLSEIQDFIENRFPYYKQHSRKLHGAIRHNLTLNDCFVKAGRRLGDKGCLWTLDKEYEGMFENGSLLRRKRRLLEGRVDKYNRNKNSKKTRKSSATKTGQASDHQELVSECTEQGTSSTSTSPSGTSTCSVSPSESSGCESTPGGIDSSPGNPCMSPFNLEQFTDICPFPGLNSNEKENGINNVCRRLSSDLSKESSPSPERCSGNEADQIQEDGFNPCAFSGKTEGLQMDFLHVTDSSTIDVPECDVQFPTSLDIPDIMNEVDMNDIQSGFTTDFLVYN